MSIMKKTIFLFFLFIITSCNLFRHKGIDFKIANNTFAPITEVKISTTENLDSTTFDNIGENKSREGFLSMKHNKIDGAYIIEYTREDGNKIESTVGYYTNGTPLNNWIRFEIKSDTTLVNFGDYPN